MPADRISGRASGRRFRTAAPLRAALLLVLFVSVSHALAADAEKRRVLILHSGASNQPSSAVLDNAIRGAIRLASTGDIEIFSEYLDALRFPGELQKARMAALLREKYAAEPISVCVAIGLQAYALLRGRPDAPCQDVPLVFAGLRDSTLQQGVLPPATTGITSTLDPLPTLELALHLQPGARTVYVVTGAGQLDGEWRAASRAAFRPHEDRLDFVHLSGMPIAKLLDEVGRAPPNSIILFLSYLLDSADRTYDSSEVASLVAASANAPVYGVYDTYLGRGLVGGYMDSYQEMGRLAGQQIVSIVAGSRPETIPVRRAASETLIVDWRELQRWKLDEDLLPVSADIRYRAPPLWEEYLDHIVVAGCVLVLQFALIVALLLQARQRRRAEDSLRESEERMSLAATSVNLGLWSWDIVGDRIWATENCRRVLGIPVGANLSLKQFLSTIPEEKRGAACRQIARAAAGRVPYDGEHRMVLADGTERWISIKGQSKAGADGRTREMGGIVIDVTDRKNAESEADLQRQQLTHLTRVSILGELSGALAHELNQPLTAILSNAQAAQRLLKKTPADIAEIDEILRDIVADDNRAGEVIRRLRALLKKGKAQFQHVDLNVLAEEILELAHSELIERSVKLKTELAPVLPVALGDRVQLQQVLLNLVMNGCEAMADRRRTDRTLTIATAHDGNGSIQVSVSDQGVGLSEDASVRLFEPFFTTKEHGLGLGLPICHSIIASHGGRIWASNNAGRGATFHFTLPVHPGAGLERR